jgi:hypothetical protein
MAKGGNGAILLQNTVGKMNNSLLHSHQVNDMVFHVPGFGPGPVTSNQLINLTDELSGLPAAALQVSLDLDQG